MQLRAAQGSMYTPFLQKRKILWRIRAFAVQIAASTPQDISGIGRGLSWSLPELGMPEVRVSENEPSRGCLINSWKAPRLRFGDTRDALIGPLGLVLAAHKTPE
jgi:hypothetical protein